MGGARPGVFIRSRSPRPVGTPASLHPTALAGEVETAAGAGEGERVQDAPPGMGIVFRQRFEDAQAPIASQGVACGGGDRSGEG